MSVMQSRVILRVLCRHRQMCRELRFFVLLNYNPSNCSVLVFI